MKLITGLGISYLQTDDSFPEWRYGAGNEYQEEIRQLKAEIAKLKICLDESKQRESMPATMDLCMMNGAIYTTLSLPAIKWAKPKNGSA